MGSEKTLTRVLASGFVVAGGAAMFLWIWPDDASLFRAGVAILSVAVSLVVLATFWKK